MLCYLSNGTHCCCETSIESRAKNKNKKKKHDRKKRDTDANSLHCNPKGLFYFFPASLLSQLHLPTTRWRETTEYQLAAAGDGENNDTQLPDTPHQSCSSMFLVVSDVSLQHLARRVGAVVGAGLTFRQVGWQ